MIINKSTWNDFASFIARGDQYEYNQAACDRLTDIMEPYIVRMKGIKPQFKAHNRTELIDFVTKEGKDFYHSAEERFQRRKAKAEGRIAQGIGSQLEILVALMQYNIAAESNPDRATIIVDRMIADQRAGLAPVCAMKYKISISKMLKLMFDRGISRSDISVIWGGSKQAINKKAQAAKAISDNSELQAALEAQGITLEGIGLDVDIQEEVKFDESLKLGNQTKEQRQEEIDRFQKGLSKFCFFTMKSGGVGLSLHHTDESIPAFLQKQALLQIESSSNKLVQDIYNALKNKNKELADKLWHRHGSEILLDDRRALVKLLKCRRKESGYVVEEDIPLVDWTKQRKCYSAPTYSAIDMVQTLGRCPRLTSLTDTEQILLFFRGTVEEDVEFICNNKLRCLSKVVRGADSWEQLITENREAIERYKQKAKEQAKDSDDPDTLIDEQKDEEDD